MAKKKQKTFWQQLSLFPTLFGIGGKKSGSSIPYIKRRAELWPELQQSAKKYEDRVYEHLKKIAKQADPSVDWDKLSRKNFFIEFFQWNSSNTDLMNYQSKLPTYPGTVRDAWQPAVPSSSIQSSIVLSPDRKRAVDNMYYKHKGFNSQLGFYAEELAEDILEKRVNALLFNIANSKNGYHHSVRSSQKWVHDTTISIFQNRPNPLNDMVLDHKYYTIPNQTGSLSEFSVTQGDTKLIPVSKNVYSPILYKDMNTELKKAVVVEILYDKYKNDKPFFFSLKDPGDIILPTEFFHAQNRFTLKSGDIVEPSQSLIRKEVHKRIEEELTYYDPDELIEFQDIENSDVGKAILHQVMQETLNKLVIANYSVKFTR